MNHCEVAGEFANQLSSEIKQFSKLCFSGNFIKVLLAQN
jgi:hypothetical protein